MAICDGRPEQRIWPIPVVGDIGRRWAGDAPYRKSSGYVRGYGGAFPPGGEVVRTYTGPNTTRDRNPMVKWPEFFENGFGELLVRLSRRSLL